MRNFLIDSEHEGVIYFTIWAKDGCRFTARCTDMDMLVAFAHQLLSAVEEVNQ